MLVKCTLQLLNYSPKKSFRLSFLQPFTNSKSLYYTTRTIGDDRSNISLEFDKYGSPEAERALIIVHGLFGSKQNWSSLGKLFQNKLQEKKFAVFCVDARNHGDSPHNPDMSYISMAADINYLIKKLSEKPFKEIVLMGHSMGGRIAMTYALASKNSSFSLLSKLVVVDVGLRKLNGIPEFEKYIQIMQDIESKNLVKQSIADSMMEQAGIKEISIRQFLLTNYKREGSGTYKFRNPLAYIKDQLDTLSRVDASLEKHQPFENPALFIAGSRSKYLPKDEYPELNKRFSDLQLETLDAGHWVHAERPKEFSEIVTNFILKG